MTTKHEQILRMMEEIGPATSEIDAVVQEDETTWALGFSDEFDVIIEWADEPSRLILTAGIGHPVADRQTEVYRTLLSYNLLWQDTGGVTTGLATEEDEAILVYELNAEQLSMSQLRTVLLNFTALARDWHEYVTSQANVNVPVSKMHEMLLLV
jgi:hypothetical protein